MFCENCGSKLPGPVNFCTGCGARVPTIAPAPQTPAQNQPTPVAYPASVAPVREMPQAAQKVPVAHYAGTGIPAEQSHPAGKCAWCGAIIDAGQPNCPKCGAASAMPSRPSNSGWAKLPGRKDIAQAEFGKSVCRSKGCTFPWPT